MRRLVEIDPDGRYPAEGLRSAERSAAAILASLNPNTFSFERTRDCFQFDVSDVQFGEDAGVVLLVTGDGLEIRLPSIEWTMGAYGPAKSSRHWKRLDWDMDWNLAPERLRSVIDEGLHARRVEFRTCAKCGRSFAPERLIGMEGLQGDVCHSCAQAQGIVF